MWTLPRPTRHHTLLQAWASAHFRNGAQGRVPDTHEQGFVTNTGRFVAREEAAKIASAAGQTATGGARFLFSEDVW